MDLISLPETVTNAENMQCLYVFILYTQSHLQCLFDAFNDVQKPDMTSLFWLV